MAMISPTRSAPRSPRPHWLPHRRMEDASELDSFLAPPHMPPAEEQEQRGISWVCIVICLIAVGAALSLVLGVTHPDVL